MKICYIAADVVVPHFRGASTHTYELSKNLVRIGHEVHVISRRESRFQKSYEVLDGVRIHRLYRGVVIPAESGSYYGLRKHRTSRLLDMIYGFYLFSVYAFYVAAFGANIVRKEKIDVIIERETSFGAGAITSALTGRPMVLEVIGPRISWLSARKARRVLAYTKMMVADRINADKIVLVTAAVDSELFKPDIAQRNEIRLRYGIAENIVVGYVGSFQAWHGVRELIQASSSVLKKHPNARLLLVGPHGSQDEALAIRFGIRDACTFTGPVEYRNIPRYMNASDILVAPYNPSASELRRTYGIGSPLKVFEYMACAKPLITTSVSPITEIIQDRINGILVRPGDVESLAEAVTELVENERLARSLGRKAREIAVRLYSWSALARRIESAIFDIMTSEHR